MKFIVEADGASRGNPGDAAYGALLRDAATGKVLAERAEPIGLASNNVAEYSGLVAGLQLVADRDPSATVEVRMDSKLVVEQMSGRWKIKHPDMRDLALQARRVLPPDQVTYTWVPRERNSAADALGNEALDVGPVRRDYDDAGDEEPSPAVVAPATAAPTGPPGVPGFSPMSEPTVFWLLRHGETVFTAERRFSGAGGADPSLSERGREQAAAAAAVLAGDIDLIIASPLARTRETAAAVAAATDIEVSIDAELVECAFGEWDGLTFSEVQQLWPDHLDRWLADTTVAPPGGESFEAVATRMAATRDRILAAHRGRRILLVTHSTTIKSLVRLALGAPAEAVFRMQLLPCSISRIDHYDDGLLSLRGFAHDAHLP